jgi:hypothetical protein
MSVEARGAYTLTASRLWRGPRPRRPIGQTERHEPHSLKPGRAPPRIHQHGECCTISRRIMGT